MVTAANYHRQQNDPTTDSYLKNLVAFGCRYQK
jgi:hypothetical protein